MINGFKPLLLITTNVHQSAFLPSRDRLMSDPGLFPWRACPAVGIFTANHCRANILKYQLKKALMCKIWACVPDASAAGETESEQWFELCKGLVWRLHQHLLTGAKWCLGPRSFTKRKTQTNFKERTKGCPFLWVLYSWKRKQQIRGIHPSPSASAQCVS